MSGNRKSGDPMPIWFFVGLILVFYGTLLVGAGALMETPDRVHRVTSVEPGLWWGAGLLIAGIAFTLAGLRDRR